MTIDVSCVLVCWRSVLSDRVSNFRKTDLLEINFAISFSLKLQVELKRWNAFRCPRAKLRNNGSVGWDLYPIQIRNNRPQLAANLTQVTLQRSRLRARHLGRRRRVRDKSLKVLTRLRRVLMVLFDYTSRVHDEKPCN